MKGSLIIWFVCACIIVLILALRTPQVSQGGQDRHWEGFAGAVNHDCYHEGGVRQIMFTTESGYDSDDYYVVCMDGFAQVVNVHP